MVEAAEGEFEWSDYLTLSLSFYIEVEITF